MRLNDGVSAHGTPLGSVPWTHGQKLAEECAERLNECGLCADQILRAFEILAEGRCLAVWPCLHSNGNHFAVLQEKAGEQG